MPIQTKAALFEADLARLATWSRALSHPARLEILRVLGRRGTCICGELVDELPLAQASVSRHLKALKDAGLISGEIDGPRSCYCLNYSAIAALREQMTHFLDGIPQPDEPLECC